ncbi:LysR family transcriptional regulator [Roseobacter denitrificans]|uniref:Transcriptional regulator, LysR family, putative n=1 Tax=Roseobacter denitrificans (strain ATCC 33942 / OCh 114) TaxID=375451 RepID=Q164T6_ROSDO|nr:LysR family transcriptional regulator [Roseobacter denitrificans]ABG32507.1 transcriptional regulator, LysR family, putative [Roseobacter denitrificans OCh 114]AVL54773.1 LysR family transcriptional regulator [Roseobacter denitrificans]SFF82792.1 transcriptional regulator, LysR family [Roseobacter denitrificans OCh 114]
MQTNWDDLRIFLAVARDNSLSGAGKRLRLDPATVGRRIQKLEAALQTVLFTKSPQGYALSETGQALLVRAEQAETAMRAAVAVLQEQSDRLSGQIRIGAPDGAANYLLPQVCAAILKENPDLEIQIVALPRVFNLSRREADMAIAVSAPTAGRLIVQKITDYKLHLAVSRDYIRDNGAIRSVADLARHNVVGYIADMIFDRELDYLEEIGLTKVPLASNSVSVQLNLIRQGGGVGVVHDFALSAAPEVARILTDEVSLTRVFYLIRHEDDRRNARLRRFADRLCNGLRAEVARLEALT